MLAEKQIASILSLGRSPVCLHTTRAPLVCPFLGRGVDRFHAMRTPLYITLTPRGNEGEGEIAAAQQEKRGQTSG